MTDDERRAYLSKIREEGEASFRPGWPMDRRYPYDSPEYKAFEAGWKKVGSYQAAVPMPSWMQNPVPYKPPAKFNAYAEARGKSQPED